MQSNYSERYQQAVALFDLAAVNKACIKGEPHNFTSQHKKTRSNHFPWCDQVLNSAWFGFRMRIETTRTRIDLTMFPWGDQNSTRLDLNHGKPVNTINHTALCVFIIIEAHNNKDVKFKLTIFMHRIVFVCSNTLIR